jgi:death-on-curing protein
MAAQRDYLTVVDALDLHRQLIELFGGSHGVRDMGALEAALFRPQSGYYDDIVQEACALLESLAINHPFIDGNKRIAFAVMDTFLRINGHRVKAKPMAIHKKMIEFFESGEFELKYLDAYFRKLITPVE